MEEKTCIKTNIIFLIISWDLHPRPFCVFYGLQQYVSEYQNTFSCYKERNCPMNISLFFKLWKSTQHHYLLAFYRTNSPWAKKSLQFSKYVMSFCSLPQKTRPKIVCPNLFPDYQSSTVPNPDCHIPIRFFWANYIRDKDLFHRSHNPSHLTLYPDVLKINKTEKRISVWDHELNFSNWIKLEWFQYS